MQGRYIYVHPAYTCWDFGVASTVVTPRKLPWPSMAGAATILGFFAIAPFSGERNQSQNRGGESGKSKKLN